MLKIFSRNRPFNWIRLDDKNFHHIERKKYVYSSLFSTAIYGHIILHRINMSNRTQSRNSNTSQRKYILFFIKCKGTGTWWLKSFRVNLLSGWIDLGKDLRDSLLRFLSLGRGGRQGAFFCCFWIAAFLTEGLGPRQ